MPIRIDVANGVIHDVGVKVEALRVVQFRVRHRFWLRRPVGRHEAADGAAVIARRVAHPLAEDSIPKAAIQGEIVTPEILGITVDCFALQLLLPLWVPHPLRVGQRVRN